MDFSRVVAGELGGRTGYCMMETCSGIAGLYPFTLKCSSLGSHRTFHRFGFIGLRFGFKNAKRTVARKAGRHCSKDSSSTWNQSTY